MENKTIKLNETTINHVFNYLITKPYNEVAQLINSLQQDVSENNRVEDKDDINE